MQRMGLASWLLLVLLSVIWGGSFYFVEVALTEVGTLTLVMLRLVLGALCLWIYIWITGIRVPLDRKTWQSFIFMGLLNNAVPFTLIVWAQTHITAGLASILNATMPVFTALVAGLCLKDEVLGVQKSAGVIAGFCGVIVLMGSSALEGIGDDLLAQLAMLGATLCYGFAVTYGRRFRRMNVDPRAVAVGQLTCSSVMLTIVAFSFEQPTRILDSSLPVILSVLALAAVSTSFAYILYFRILASAGAVNLSLVTLLIPVSAILLGVTLLGEQILAEHITGMLIIGIGLILIDGRLWNRLLQKNHERNTQKENSNSHRCCFGDWFGKYRGNDSRRGEGGCCRSG